VEPALRKVEREYSIRHQGWLDLAGSNPHAGHAIERTDAAAPRPHGRAGIGARSGGSTCDLNTAQPGRGGHSTGARRKPAPCYGQQRRPAP